MHKIKIFKANLILASKCGITIKVSSRYLYKSLPATTLNQTLTHSSQRDTCTQN